MCGIGGIYHPEGSKPVPAHLAFAGWCALEDRGTHASGMALRWTGADKDIIYKAEGAASSKNFLAYFNKNYGSGKNVRYVMFHTRYTTQGSAEKNGNNHPVVGHGINLTHNGVLWGESSVFTRLGVTRLHDVDTEAINAALSRKSPGWALDNITGSMSVAWTDRRDSSETVNLMTNGGNPLVIGRTKSGAIVWASTENHLAHLDMDSWFNATPFKHYTISADGTIRSEFVSKQRKMSNRQLRHASSFGGQGFGYNGSRSHSKAKKSSRVSRTTKKKKASHRPRWITLDADEWEYLEKYEMYVKKNGAWKEVE